MVSNENSSSVCLQRTGQPAENNRAGARWSFNRLRFNYLVKSARKLTRYKPNGLSLSCTGSLELLTIRRKSEFDYPVNHSFRRVSADSQACKYQEPRFSGLNSIALSVNRTFGGHPVRCVIPIACACFNRMGKTLHKHLSSHPVEMKDRRTVIRF